MRGTLYLSACRHTVSVCGSTPETASRMAMAPSRTRSERSTSIVKSTWPGVSMMLIRGGGRDGDPALLLLDHPVHGGGALVHLADLVRSAGVIEHPFRGGGLAGIDVGHDADVPGFLERVLRFHDAAFPSARRYSREEGGRGSGPPLRLSVATSGSARTPCWPPPSCECLLAFSRPFRDCWRRPAARPRVAPTCSSPRGAARPRSASAC